MVDYLTNNEKGGVLYQNARNLWNLHSFISEELNDLSATATHAVIKFPFKIKILGTSIECLAAQASTFALIMTDGTNAITTTVDGSATSEHQAVSQEYAKETRLSIYSNGVAGLTAAGARFMFHYVIDEIASI